jgi:hypothetical protein
MRCRDSAVVMFLIKTFAASIPTSVRQPALVGPDNNKTLAGEEIRSDVTESPEGFLWDQSERGKCKFVDIQ